RRDAFSRGIDINPSYMPCHYELAIAYGVCGRTEEAQAEAAIVKADWPSVSTGFILDRSLAEIYSRGKHVAGLDSSLLHAREVARGAAADASRPARGHGLEAGVETHAFRAVDGMIAEQRALPPAERVVGDRNRDRHIDANHADLDGRSKGASS